MALDERCTVRTVNIIHLTQFAYFHDSLNAKIADVGMRVFVCICIEISTTPNQPTDRPTNWPIDRWPMKIRYDAMPNNRFLFLSCL